MERVAETAELLGVEASIGTDNLVIGHAAKDFIAGAISGMVGICAGQPLDTLRVRLQQQGCQQNSAAALWRAIGATEGVRGFFRGMSYPLYTTALQNAVTFQAQGAASRLLTGNNSRTPVSWQHTCLSGMFAGAVSSCITSPVELLKIRMQLQKALPGKPDYLGPLRMLQHVVGQEGLRGLTRGLGITLMRDTPSYGFYFCIYHYMVQGLGKVLYPATATQQQPQFGLQSVHQEQQQQQQVLVAHAEAHWQAEQQQCAQQQPQQREALQQVPGASEPLVQFLAGGFAGALAWMSIYPIDVVKSRIQALPHHVSPHRSAWDCALTGWRQEGSGVFVKGLGPTMGRGFVVNATIFAAFEALMKAMEG